MHLFKNPSTPDFYIAELKGSYAKRSLHRQALRHAIGLAFRLFRDASIRAAIMDARPKGLGGQTPSQSPVNVDLAKNFCSVNFRLFSADKERSEFEKCSVSSKILQFKIPQISNFYIAELKKSGAERSRNMLIFKCLKHNGIEWTLRAKTIRAQEPAHLHVMALLG